LPQASRYRIQSKVEASPTIGGIGPRRDLSIGAGQREANDLVEKQAVAHESTGPGSLPWRAQWIPSFFAGPIDSDYSTGAGRGVLRPDRPGGGQGLMIPTASPVMYRSSRGDRPCTPVSRDGTSRTLCRQSDGMVECVGDRNSSSRGWSEGMHRTHVP
jgi:hypothetical protein